MPVPSNVPPVLDFSVLQQSLVSPGPVEYRISASYFVEEGAYTLFKNSAHSVVGAFRTDMVLLISREDAVHGA